MTLPEARAHIGDQVVYSAGHDDIHEHGQIRSVSSRFVFVVYDGQHCPKGTAPEMLTLDVPAVAR